jgi:hypothetical protein
MKHRPTTIAAALWISAATLGCGPRSAERIPSLDANIGSGGIGGVGRGGTGGGGGSGFGGGSGGSGGTVGGVGGGGGGGGGGAGGSGGLDAAAGLGGSGGSVNRYPDGPQREVFERLEAGVLPPAPRLSDGPPPLDGAFFDVPAAPDRPPLPDGQFHYPNLDGKLCGSDEYVLPKFTADALVVLDRSGSMSDRLGTGTGAATKWAEAAAAVKATVAGTANVSWGLKLFPTGNQRCASSATVDVPVSGTSAAAIRTAIDGAGPPMGTLGEGTPTSATVKAATAYLRSVAFPFSKYIVLATDGAPTCLAESPDMRDEARAIAAIAEAAAAGFKTYVIGIATAAADVDTLNRMAEAGGTARPGSTRYYPATSRAELAAALDAISTSLVTCVFPLAHQPPDPSFVTVTVGGKPILRDLQHQQGWDYVSGGAGVQIYGTACESLKKATVAGAGIYYGCPQ